MASAPHHLVAIRFAEVLSELGVDEEVVSWAADYDDPQLAWLTCPRSLWLVRIALRAGVDRPLVVRAAEACATLAIARLPKHVRAPARTLHLVRRWVAGEVEAAACWAAGFAASGTATELEGQDALAARSAACVAFACDSTADPLYYSVRAHAVEAIDLAEQAMGGQASVRAVCAAEVRRHLRAEYVLSCLNTAVTESQRPAAPFTSMEHALEDGVGSA